MNADGAAGAPFWTSWRAMGVFLAALTAGRVGVLVLSPLNLHGDEAQYWAWSRVLEWGYFTKPPLIAWTIRATTALFGDAEWAVRLASPLAHAGTAALICALGRAMYGPRVGAWAGLGWALMPGVWLSSALISTDALLLLCWAGALLCAWRLIETRGWRWAIGLGAACGLGLLAKYAMGYFFVGAALACVVSPRARAGLVHWRGLAALGVALAIVAPNLVWNAQHRFATLAHTAANADLKHGPALHPGEALDFLLGQLAVFGPLHFALLAFLIFSAARRWRDVDDKQRFLLAFALPALAVIAVQAAISRANANWAAAAYPSACVWVAAYFADGKALKANAALHALVGCAFVVLALSPTAANAAGLANGLKRARGWQETAAIVAAQSAAAPYSAIMVDSRLYFYALTYYWREHPPAAPLRVWRWLEAPSNQAEAEASLAKGEDSRVLAIVTHPDEAWRVTADFQRFTPLTRIAIPLGGGKTRQIDLYVAAGYAPNPKRGAALRPEDLE